MAVSLDKVPTTPAEVAGAVLDNIARDASTFDMDTWANLRPGDELAPTDPVCGTTLCAAGWAAHVTGWTIKFSRYEVEVFDRWGEVDSEANLYAEKNGERRNIGDVAAEVLGLDDHETFWLATPEDAIDRLNVIAGRS